MDWCQSHYYYNTGYYSTRAVLNPIHVPRRGILCVYDVHIIDDAMMFQIAEKKSLRSAEEAEQKEADVRRLRATQEEAKVRASALAILFPVL